MKPAEYEKVKTLFADALEIAPQDRAIFLDKNCADAEIRSEVESLLSINREAENFLNQASAVEVVRDSYKNKSVFLGKKIEKYRIEHEIGRGGMGVVFLATREDFRQQVALKILKRGMDSEAIVERFAREREILAALNHPFIARLLDGGTTEDDLPFFVMEYVEGEAVDDYCRRKNLSEAERLELFRKICAAVSFAHQKLIVHRDLKPSNILVTEDGTPKLLDFGIAKLLNSDARETQTNQRVLTPAYASPEQMRGEIVSTSSDVYSLGLILAKMLEAQSPKAKVQNSPDRFFELKNQTDKQKTKTDFQNLSGDLSNIIEMSLREDAARRYGSSEAFSEDVRRYLAGLPISARKDSRFYRASKFVQRNRTAAVISALLILSLIGGLAATLWQFRNARAERARAERRFNDVRGLVNNFLSELNDEMSKVSGATKARQILVGRTLEYLDNASREAGGDQALKRELATAYIKIGDIQGNSYYQNFGDTSGALASYQKALEILEQLVSENPSDKDTKIQLAKGYESTGDVLWDKGDLNATRENYRKAAAIVEPVAAENPLDKETQLYLSQLDTALGDIEYTEAAQSFKNIPLALEFLHKGLAIREKFFAAEPNDKTLNIYLDQSYHRLTNVYYVKGDAAAELEFLEKDKTVVEKLLAAYPQESNRKRAAAVCYAQFEKHLIDSENFTEAQKYAAKSIALRQEIYNADQTEVRAQRDLAYGYETNGKLQMEIGDFRAALSSFQNQLRVYKDLAQIDASNIDRKRDLIDALINVGRAQNKTRDNSAADENFRRALEITKNFPEDDPEIQSKLADIYEGFGVALLNQNGKNIEAIDNFQKAIALREAETKNDDQNAVVLAALAENYYEAGQVSERTDKSAAQKWYKKSLIAWNILRARNALRKIDEKKFAETNRAFSRI